MRASASVGPGIRSLTIEAPARGSSAFATIKVNGDVLYNGRSAKRYEALMGRWLYYWTAGMTWAEIRWREKKLRAWPKEWR